MAFEDGKKFVGFHGSFSASGIESLGFITQDIACSELAESTAAQQTNENSEGTEDSGEGVPESETGESGTETSEEGGTS